MPWHDDVMIADGTCHKGQVRDITYHYHLDIMIEEGKPEMIYAAWDVESEMR